MDKKIRLLFEHRGIYSMGDGGGYDLATRVQQEIYQIDHYYEAVAKTELGFNDERWERIQYLAQQGPQPCDCDAMKSIQDLRRYERIEQRVHDRQEMVPGELQEIVHLKKSDIALARSLVGSSHSKECRGFLDAFDKLSEVVEDHFDIPEDRADWNFNFWLYPIREPETAIRVRDIQSLLEGLAVRAEEEFSALNVKERSRWEARWEKLARQTQWVLYQPPVEATALIRYDQMVQNVAVSGRHGSGNFEVMRTATRD